MRLIALTVAILVLAGCTTSGATTSAPTVTVLEASDLAHVTVKLVNNDARDLRVSPNDFTLIDATERTFPMDFVKTGTWAEEGRFPITTLAPHTFAQGFLSFPAEGAQAPFTLRVNPGYGVSGVATATFNLTA